VEGGKRILPTFAESLAKKAARRLERLGVKDRDGRQGGTGRRNGVIADGKRIPSATVLWTAGVAPAPILKLLGAKTDRAGRVSVGPFMNVPDVSGVVRHRRCIIGRAGWTAGARRGASGDPARALCRTPDLATAQGTGAKTSIPILRQGQHGGRRQEFCDLGERAPSHERVRYLDRLDFFCISCPFRSCKTGFGCRPSGSGPISPDSAARD